MVNITYIGHACFKLACEGQTIIVDPYSDGSVPGLGDVREAADFVYCSHGHHDHNAAECVTLAAPAAAPKFTVEEIVVPHDDCGGEKRGMNTVRVFSFGPLRVAHMGDTGRTLTDDEAARLAGVDCMLLPVGGFFTVDAQAATRIVVQTKPRVVVPMHYRGEAFGFDVIAPLGAFTDCCGLPVRYGESGFSLDKDTQAGVLVLRPANSK